VTVRAAEFDAIRCSLEGTHLVEASAGTGKTWSICTLVLRLIVERGLRIEQILVVTFTRAAAGDLRARIRARLDDALQFLDGVAPADEVQAALLEQVVARGAADRELLRRRLDLALQSFDQAAIFTIHGFCQRALADAPFAAHLPLAFEVVAEDDELVRQAAQDFWRREIVEPAVGPALASFLERRGDSPQTFARLLRRRLQRPLARNAWPDDGAPADVRGDEAANAYAAARAEWLARRDDIVAALAAAGPSLNARSYNADSIAQGRREWDDAFRADDPFFRGEGATSKRHLYRASFIARSTNRGRQAPQAAFFALAEEFMAAAERLGRACRLARLRLVRRLLEDAPPRLRARKRADRIVTFDDMLSNLHQRLCAADGDTLAATLAQRYPAALIDEFQDTDPLQHGIFRAIHGGGRGALFLVGDPKQAIYSFRQADLHTYLQAKRGAAELHTLSANQRARRGLVDAINGLFSGNEAAFMVPGVDYAEATYGARARPAFDDPTEARGDLHVWMLPRAPGTALTRRDARIAAARATAAEIARLVAAGSAGRIRWDERHLGAGDIAVLVRGHADGAQMKRALAALGVGSVELSPASVFQSIDAEELERILGAVLEPGRSRSLRAALGTEMLGADAAAIAALDADDAAQAAWIERFDALRDLWRARGIGTMVRSLLTRERVAERLLALADGERRMTNVLHLAECLHEAAATHPEPEALLRWLGNQRREPGDRDATQLRLESDRNLVQIVTIHRAKGLEYPIVFCPFLWDRGTRKAVTPGEGDAYHEDDGALVIDFRGEEIDAQEAAAVGARIQLEEAAEEMRLIYVALTRAAARCYLVAGCFVAHSRASSVAASARGLLNWLVAGSGVAPPSWLAGTPTLERTAVEAAWDDLQRRCAPHVVVAALPSAAGHAVPHDGPHPGRLRALPPPAPIVPGWRIGSYSALAYQAQRDDATADHDARAGRPRTSSASAADIDPDDILRFPRGPAAGDLLHAVLERVDFTQPTEWPSRIAAVLGATAGAAGGRGPDDDPRRLGRMVLRMLNDLVATPIAAGLALRQVSPERRLTELEFSMPARDLRDADLNRLLRSSGYPVPRLAFVPLDGYLAGAIDLVVESDGRYFIVDWKSNHLGYAREDYAAASLAAAMAEHGYHLQALLYAVALDRYLRRRVAGYRYAAHFGGVLYLFLRGVRPSWIDADGSALGVVHDRPRAETIGALDRMIGGDGRGA